MSGLMLLGWGGLLTTVAMLVVLGGAPVVAVRCIARLYPQGHPRRTELVGEMTYIGGIGDVARTYLWLGGTFVTAAAEGIPARRQARQATRVEKMLPHEQVREGLFLCIVGITALVSAPDMFLVFDTVTATAFAAIGSALLLSTLVMTARSFVELRHLKGAMATVAACPDTSSEESAELVAAAEAMRVFPRRGGRL